MMEEIFKIGNQHKCLAVDQQEIEGKFSNNTVNFLPCYSSDIPKKDGDSVNKGCCVQTIEGLYIVMLCEYILC